MADALKLVKVFWPLLKLLFGNFVVLGAVGFIVLWVVFPRLKPFIPRWQISPKVSTWFWGGLITILILVGSIYIVANV